MVKNRGFLHFSKKYSKCEWFCDGGNILTASDFDILSVSLLRTIFFEYSKCESVALILGLIESCAMFCRFDSCVTQDCYLRCFVHAAAQNADMFIALWASLNEGVFKDHSWNVTSVRTKLTSFCSSWTENVFESAIFQCSRCGTTWRRDFWSHVQCFSTWWTMKVMRFWAPILRGSQPEKNQIQQMSKTHVRGKNDVKH